MHFSDLRSRKRPDAEIEAIALISQALIELERLKWAAEDASIAALAQAVDALELGAHEQARRLARRSLAEHTGAPDTPDRARTIVQALALDQLRARFLRLVAGGAAPGALRPDVPAAIDPEPAGPAEADEPASDTPVAGGPPLR